MNEAIILAGGLGTRLRSIVDRVPKPMAPIGKNKIPFLEVQINNLINKGLSKFIISVGYKKEIIIKHFSYVYKNCQIDYAQEDKPLGTGGAILNSIHKLSNKYFLVVNGDTFFDLNISNFFKFHNENNADVSVAGFNSSETNRYAGIDVLNNKILSFNSLSSSICNAGYYICNKNFLQNKCSLQTFAFEKFLEQTSESNNYFLFDKNKNNTFLDIGIPSDYINANIILNNFMEK